MTVKFENFGDLGGERGMIAQWRVEAGVDFVEIESEIAFRCASDAWTHQRSLPSEFERSLIGFAGKPGADLGEDRVNAKSDGF
jgi:hypothetical protein